ncbi:FRG domain-containing protein [Paraburkholderia sp. SOS3]|uniref:FRG domain-containing protein n=1 Tax=Paraburkholderia sp. SOS3 TaxID=1926494 RepID=UPI0018DC2C31|nr:FRG domain-containing protein [Paraburkholderia sp. SOS3]
MNQNPPNGPFLPSMTWTQNRIMLHAMDKGGLPTWEKPETYAERSAELDECVEPAYQQRARYFKAFTSAFAQIGTLPDELRLSIEPLHPLPTLDLKKHVTKRLAAFGVKAPDAHQGLGLVSRALLNSYYPQARLFDLVIPAPPTSHPDLFLFDPLIGFVLWEEDGKIHNDWLGNKRDLADLIRLPTETRRMLYRSQGDLFRVGSSLMRRVIIPLLSTRREFASDDADIPTITIDSQRDLDALVDDLRTACARAPFNVSAVFRGQTEEHRLPDRSELVATQVTPYSDVKDHSVIPSLYRHYDQFLDDPSQFRGFVSHLSDWCFYSDLIFGDPARYLTPDGHVYKPKGIGSDSTLTIQFFQDAPVLGPRSLDNGNPYTRWTVSNGNGEVQDEYVKHFRMGHYDVRRNLVLQHYGAPTPYIDVTHDIRVAEWFAFNKLSVTATGLSSNTELAGPLTNSAIFVFLVPDGAAPLVNTEQLTSPDEALRPHRQACAVLGGSGALYRNAASRFIGLKIKFADGFRPSNLPNARHLFPGPDEDPMLKRLLAMYEVPHGLMKTFPVYWFPS